MNVFPGVSCAVKNEDITFPLCLFQRRLMIFKGSGPGNQEVELFFPEQGFDIINSPLGIDEGDRLFTLNPLRQTNSYFGCRERLATFGKTEKSYLPVSRLLADR